MSCNNIELCSGCHPSFASSLHEPSRAQSWCSTYELWCSEIPTCSGCLSDQPNQLAHMDPGGCLYVDVEELVSNIQADPVVALENGALATQQEEPKKLKVNISKPLVAPLFAIPSKFQFSECAVCYEPIEMVNVAITTCGHSFHASCAFKAIGHNNCCPMCRHQLVAKDGEDDDEAEQSEGEVVEDEDEEAVTHDEIKVSLEQLSGKLTNMGYTLADIMKSLLPNLKSHSEAKYTEEFSNKLHYDIHDIMDGTISLADRDTRSYADVV